MMDMTSQHQMEVSMNTHSDTANTTEDLIDLGAASVETKGKNVSGIDDQFQKLPNTMGLIAD